MKAILRDGLLDGLVCEIAQHGESIERTLKAEETESEHALGLWLRTEETETVEVREQLRGGRWQTKTHAARVYRFDSLRKVTRLAPFGEPKIIGPPRLPGFAKPKPAAEHNGQLSLVL